MDFATIFSVGNMVALTGWLAMLVGLFAKPVRNWAFLYSGLILPALLAVAYVYLLASQMFGPSTGGPAMDFSSLAGVRTLFDNPWVLLAGWTHYLAFDLFIGGWEARDARRRGIPHLLVVPALVLTFLLGPAGLLLYLAIRRFKPVRECRPCRPVQQSLPGVPMSEGTHITRAPDN